MEPISKPALELTLYVAFRFSKSCFGTAILLELDCITEDSFLVNRNHAVYLSKRHPHYYVLLTLNNISIVLMNNAEVECNKIRDASTDHDTKSCCKLMIVDFARQ